MRYKYAPNDNYADYATGRVLLTQAGATAFPVRLASEIFQRCAAYLPQKTTYRLFDPCCGGGALLTTLGFLHGTQIHSLLASDIDPTMCNLAADNLALLTPEGLQSRREDISQMLNEYGKDSHRAALTSVEALRQQLPAPMMLAIYRADALSQTLAAHSVDILITDVPYGDLTAWQGIADPDTDPLTQLLDAQLPVLAPQSIVAIISDKAQKASHPAYRQLKNATLGKRRILFLQPR